ncbi:MAG: PEP-CTERM sorting domain-containing protein [Planctomycetota bacterium]
MKLKLLFSAILMLPAASLFAQHSDVELGYDDTANPTGFVIEQDNVTSDGLQIFEAEFEALDPFNTSDLSSDEPGFATNAAEGLLMNSGDQLWLTALDGSVHSSFGVGYVNYYNPTSGNLEAAGRLAVLDNSAGTPDLVLNGASVESGPVTQFLDTADSAGDIHDHFVLDLLDDSTAPIGAYGVLFQLQADFDTPDGTMDVSSDPFWIVWNHGLSEADFEDNALPTFGFTAVPEPGSAGLLMLIGGVWALRRRR